jgi:ATP-dependent helicase YprA (DUF1998 family)
MNPLELADRLREDYRRFTWTTYPIADRGLRERLEHLVDTDALLWRGPYLSVQPRFRLDATLPELAGRIGLPAEVVRAFPQVDRLFAHQAEAITRISAGLSTLVATGTGSGKTEAFLVPVVAHAFGQRHRPGVKAIALYPMNALVNDQEDRVRTACEALGLRYGVYTGATPAHERARMQENPPDILLTNYSMLEFILTRREDRKLFGAGMLRYLVLDEIHTYQGALGSEIACLVRRLRGHVDVDGLVCVGLSATVSAGGDHDADVRRTAAFAADLFAVPFGADGIVEESPVDAPISDPASIGPAPDPAALRAALAAGGDPGQLRAALGDPQASPMLDLLRAELARPRTVEELVGVLAALPQRTGADPGRLRNEVAGWLLLGAGTHTSAGPPVLEAKVHVFLRSLPHLVRCAGEAGHLLPSGTTACLRDRCGAQATFPLGVCLGCGQDYDLEPAAPGGQVLRYAARSLHADPVETPDTRSSHWYPSRRCVRCGSAASAVTCLGCGAPTREVTVAEPEASPMLTRCPVCGYGRNAGAVEEFTARTAAAITATAFSLHSGLAAQSDDAMLRRLLVFADSRQDTAFQAGYLRGRARALRVRRLITEAVRDRDSEGRPPASFNSLVEDVFRRGRGSGLYEDPAGADARQRALRVCEWDVLGEIASDERRPPTLERLGLITVGYPGLERLSRQDLDPLLAHLGPDEEAVRWLLARILDLARTRRGVAHELLRTRLEAKTEAELAEAGATVRVGQPVTGLGDTTVKLPGTSAISMGYRGSVAAMIRKVFPGVTGSDPVERAIRAAAELLARHQILEDVQVGTGKARIRLRQVTAQAIEVRPATATLHRCLACRAVQPGPSPRDRCATFNCKGMMRPWNGDPRDYERQLASGDEPLVINAEEHSGQVPLETREQIEARFKDGDLNLLVCTMTLELGVDLGQLLAVILRNVPPRPSNYAQRAGRAGRREERVALIVTFAGGLPHDSYYYARPVEMIRGAIRPPAFLLDNQRVITRHARALALELCGEDLPVWMGELVSDKPDGQLQDIEPVRDALAAGAETIAARIHEVFRLGLTDDQLPWLTHGWSRDRVGSWIADLDTAIEAYRVRQKTLIEEWDQAASTRTRESARAIVSINAGLEAMRRTDRARAYTLSYLSSVGFLPSYAFPTDTTSLFLERESVELSQDSVQALKDYAPGQLVYARGTKWLVEEVDLRRANLVNAEGAGALPTVNICPRCDTVNDKTAASCLSCDNDDLLPQLTVPMRAMRAERRQRISSDEEQRSRRPFEVTHHLGAPKTAETWLFERPGLVFQWERGADLTILNRGRTTASGSAPEQFMICTSCGMWFEPPAATGQTQAQKKRHDWHDKRCTNHDLQFSVLMTERRVDCLQIVPDMEDLDIRLDNLQEFLASIRAALDLGCRIVLQSGDSEVAGFDWPRPDPNSDDAMLRLAVLYEEVPGGAGYLRQLAERFGEVAATLVPILDDCLCERSCYACLRSYGNQREAELLDRHLAAGFLRRFIRAPDADGRRIPAFSDGFLGLPRSPIERRLAVALIDAHAPRGHAQYPWGDRGSTDGNPRPVTVIDFAWPGQKVAVFCDGWQNHHTAERRAADKAKRDALAADGWTVLSFWGGQIIRDARGCAREILSHLSCA